jgi:hypothetical protein
MVPLRAVYATHTTPSSGGSTATGASTNGGATLGQGATGGGSTTGASLGLAPAAFLLISSVLLVAMRE